MTFSLSQLSQNSSAVPIAAQTAPAPRAPHQGLRFKNEPAFPLLRFSTKDEPKVAETGAGLIEGMERKTRGIWSPSSHAQLLKDCDAPRAPVKTEEILIQEHLHVETSLFLESLKMSDLELKAN